MNDTPTTRTDERKASFALDTIRQLELELTAALEEINTLKTMCISNANEANDLRQQRDRLAEALSQCREDSVQLLGDRDWWQYEIRLDYQKRYQETRDNVTRADEALQSLNQYHTVATNDMIPAVKGDNHES